ncbi:MAG: hypothetical protein E3J87_05305 [Candidatus Cloacimonadota bacterium]|nr:MAG: hypothetical protein E3J87_05305 [Candidatus Cloacimonadota bacterium]
MDYKEKLRELKEKKEWEKLLSASLELYEQDKKERYIIRMIILACEKLGKENDVIPFWEMLAKGENRPEEFSKKLTDYYKKTEEQETWLKWTKRLLLQVLRKKDFDTLEDLWMQLIEAEAIDKTYAFDVASKVETLEEFERAFTLLDLFLLSLEEKKPLPRDVIEIAKRMLEIEGSKVTLRRRLENFYRTIYSGCSEIENFLEKAEINSKANVKDATLLLEKLLNFCPGRYVAHKTWGVGKIVSIDLLFNRLFVDFPALPEHSISLELAFNILSPLEEDDFPVLKIEKKDYLLSLKKENPVLLIKLLLKNEETLSQERVKPMLKGIVNDDEWKTFIEKAKKEAQSKGIEIQRKGNKYVFTRARISKRKRLSMETIKSISDTQKKIEFLFAISRERLTLEEKERWVGYVEEILRKKDISLQKRIELLFIQTNVTGNKNSLKDGLDLLLKDIKRSEKILLISNLSQKRYKKELLLNLGEKDYIIAEKIFLETADDWLRSHSQKILEKKENTKELLLKALQNPYKNPLCFLYCAERIMKGKEKTDLVDKPIILFETLLEFTAKKDALQKIRSKAKAVFSKYCFDIYRWALETSSKEEITILIDIIKKAVAIDSEDKKVLERLAETKYPTLKKTDIEEFFYVTREAIKKKEKELDHLLKIEIPANSEAIGKAARQGDLSENFDYISAKEKQRRLFDRANMLENELSKARPIEDIGYIEGEVGIGTRIILEETKKEKIREILILGPWDSDPHKEVVSHTSPLAGELLGKKVGESFFDNYHKKTYRIVSVEKI